MIVITAWVLIVSMLKVFIQGYMAILMMFLQYIYLKHKARTMPNLVRNFINLKPKPNPTYKTALEY